MSIKNYKGAIDDYTKAIELNKNLHKHIITVLYLNMR